MMRARSMQRLVIVFLLLYAIFTVYPGVLPFRGPGPFLLGLPFPFIWISGWIIAGFVVLLLIDRVYRDAEASDRSGE